MSNKAVWVIEDDAGAAFVYEEILSQTTKLTLFPNLAAFHAALRSEIHACPPDLVIADLRLPDGIFLTFLATPAGKSFAQEYPVIVVSAWDDVEILRQCFQAGAADFLTKPFARSELLVKTEKFLEAYRKPKHDSLPSITIDPVSLQVQAEGTISPPLTPREFQILMVFQGDGKREASRADIVEKIWGSTFVNPKTLDVHMVNLRRKLAVVGVGIEITTSGVYRLSSLSK